MKLSFAPLLASAAICFSSCATTEKKPEEKAKPEPVAAPKLIGRIASIPADKRFVLIQSYGKWEQESGAILTTRGPDERTANLRATGEKLGEFAAADVQSGTFEKGDAVYSQHAPKPVLTAPTPEVPNNQTGNPIETEAVSPPENVQKNN